MHKRTPTRAAGVSPPWSVNRTRCSENRPPFDDDATNEQERRASARRGTGNRICNGDRLFRAQHVRPGTVGFHPTAGLRQPLLVASADAVADVRFVSASPLPIPTAGLRQPLLVARRVFRAECDICDAQTHVHTRAAGVSPPWSVNRTQCGENRPPFDDDATHEQERRASARRGSVNRTQCGENRPPSDDDATHEQERRASARRGTGKRVCNGDRLFRTQRVPPDTVGFHPTAGLHQPLLVASADAVADVRFVSASPLPTPRLAYASRSWLHDVCSVRNATFAMHKRMCTRAAGVSPPWSVNRTQCGENRPPFDDDATHEQERRASARRGTGKRVCNGDRLFRAQRVPPGTIAFHPTAGLHQPLLVASADAVADVRFVSASPLPIPTAGLRQPLLVAHDIQRFDCRAYPPVTKLPEPFFHPNRIKTTTLYPTGRGAARTYSEKQSRYERAKKRGEFPGCSNVFGEAIPPTRFTAPGEFGSRGVARTQAEKRAAGRWLVPVISATVANLSNGSQKPVRFTTALFLADRGPGGMIIVPDKCRLGLPSAEGGEFSL
jgi:hypothetical protein